MTTSPSPGFSAAALRGAVDLGALAAARSAAERPAGAGAAGGGSGAFSIDVTTAEFEDAVIRASLTVPVVLDLWASWCGPCKQLSPILERLADEYNGRFILAKVDVDAEQQIAAAFQVQSIPSVFAVLGGQPVPLFQGAQPEPQIRQILDELLRVAAENGINGISAPLHGATSDDTEVETPADPKAELFDAAADAVEAGDWELAATTYDAILALDPQDADARAGKTLVALQARLDGVDATAALAASDADPTNVDAAIVAADVEIATGQPAQAYARLLTAVRRNTGAERDRARARLLECFELAGPDDPDVTAARRALATALY